MDETTQLGEVRPRIGVRFVDEEARRGEHTVDHAVRRAPSDVVGAGGGEVDLHASER
jgi:hypothetical protein